MKVLRGFNETAVFLEKREVDMIETALKIYSNHVMNFPGERELSRESYIMAEIIGGHVVVPETR